MPTANKEDIERETAEALVQKWKEQAGQVEALGIDATQLLAQSIITPSCGTGAIDLEHALKVLQLNRDVSASLQGLGNK